MECFAGGRGIENVVIGGKTNEVWFNWLPEDASIVLDVSNSYGDSEIDVSDVGDVKEFRALSSSEDTTGTRWIAQVEIKVVVVDRLAVSETLVFVKIPALYEESLVDARDADVSKMMLAMSSLVW